MTGKLIVTQKASMGIDCGSILCLWNSGNNTYQYIKFRWYLQMNLKDPTINEMLVKVSDLDRSYNVNNIYVDGANPEFILFLKIRDWRII